MRRLRISGAAVATPRLGEAKLREALILLGVGGCYDDGGVHEIHLRIAEIIGLWFSEQEAKEASPVAKALLSTGRNLLEASRVLSGHQTGIHTSVEIQATTEAVRLLALDPTIGSIDTAKTLVGNFHEQSAKIGHACLVAWADLAEEGGQKGRPALHWYDDFTSLLLDIAKKAGVKASIGRDRATRERTGWLFQAAQVPSARTRSAFLNNTLKYNVKWLTLANDSKPRAASGIRPAGIMTGLRGARWTGTG
jgi:hypothetical protein